MVPEHAPEGGLPEIDRRCRRVAAAVEPDSTKFGHPVPRIVARAHDHAIGRRARHGQNARVPRTSRRRRGSLATANRNATRRTDRVSAPLSRTSSEKRARYPRRPSGHGRWMPSSLGRVTEFPVSAFFVDSPLWRRIIRLWATTRQTRLEVDIDSRKAKPTISSREPTAAAPHKGTRGSTRP